MIVIIARVSLKLVLPSNHYCIQKPFFNMIVCLDFDDFLFQRTIEYKGILFPTNMSNTHSVNQVMLQEAGKLKVKDLRDSKLFHIPYLIQISSNPLINGA